MRICTSERSTIGRSNAGLILCSGIVATRTNWLNDYPVCNIVLQHEQYSSNE